MVRIKEILDNGLSLPEDDVEYSGLSKIQNSSRASFRSLFKEYDVARITNDTEAISMIEDAEPIMQDAYDVLGVKLVRALGYRQCDVVKALNNHYRILECKDDIVRMLNLSSGKWISARSLKLRLNYIYKTLSINALAKATDIRKFFKAERMNRRIEGASVHGFIIL